MIYTALVFVQFNLFYCLSPLSFLYSSHFKWKKMIHCYYLKLALSRIHLLRKNERVATAIPLTASIIMLSRPLWQTSMKMVVILNDKGPSSHINVDIVPHSAKSCYSCNVSFSLECQKYPAYT